MPVQCFLSACKTCHALNPVTYYWCTPLQSYVIECHAFQVLHDIFITEELHKNFDSLLIVDDMSDHLPALALLKQKRL